MRSYHFNIEGEQTTERGTGNNIIEVDTRQLKAIGRTRIKYVSAD